MIRLVRYAAMVCFLLVLSFDLLYAANPANDPYYAVQVGSISEKAKAQKLVRRLGFNKFDCETVKVGYYYKVICGRLDTKKQGAALKYKLKTSGFKGAFTVTVKGSGEHKAITAISDDTQKPDKNFNVEPAELVNSPIEFDLLLSQVVNDPSPTVGAEIFGRGGGHFHPFAGIGFRYTDNTLYTKAASKSELKTSVNTGFWTVFPSWKGPVKDVTISGATPGGVRVGSRSHSIAKGAQGFFMFRADHDIYSRFDSENFTTLKGRAFLGLGSSRGHTFALDNIYISSRDPLQVGMFNGAGEYTSNRLSTRLGFRVSPKISLSLSHTSYNIDYPNTINAYMNRSDSLAGVGLSFKFSPKTSLSLMYRSINVDYDSPLKTDRTEVLYSMGFGWKITGRTAGSLNYSRSENEYDGFARDGDDTQDRIAIDFAIRKSSKTAFRLLVAGSRLETDYQASDYIIRTLFSFKASWAPTSKVVSSLLLSLQNNDYWFNVTGGSDTLARSDDVFSIGTSLKYLLAKRTAISFGFNHKQRRSNIAPFEYDMNAITASVFVSF